MTYPKIKIANPSVDNGLDWLVARDEGWFAREGLCEKLRFEMNCYLAIISRQRSTDYH